MENEIDFSSIIKGQFLTDDQAMALAMHVARAGAAYVSPNPLVGCVVLNSENKFLSSGYHQRYGEAHAEINALHHLTDIELEEAQVFVTLEPCAHEGRTGSCAKKLTSYKIKRVFYGLEDPNPLVSGKGAQILKSAGIEAVEYQGKYKSDLEDLAEIFLKNFRQEKVFIAMKVASSLDGQIALKNGESQWITGPESREYVHELRSWYDAVLVGRKTIEVDNPSLNIRHQKIVKENKVIILDPQAELLGKINAGKKYKFLETHKKENIYFAVQKAFSIDYQTILFKDLNHLTQQLWNLNFKSIFVEGGATTCSSFLNSGLINRLYLFVNPSIIGSAQGLSWTKDLGINSLNQKIKLKNPRIQLFGADIHITGTI